MLRQAIDKFGHSLYSSQQHLNQYDSCGQSNNNVHAAMTASLSASFADGLHDLERRLLDKTLTLDSTGTAFDARNKQIRLLANPKVVNDAVTVDFINKRVVSRVMHNTLNNRVEKLETALKDLESKCLRLNPAGDAWDSKNLRLTNTAPSQEMNDVSTMSQTCTYDPNIGNFKCGNRTFNLVESSANTPIVTFTVDSKGMSHLSMYNDPSGNPIHPSDFVRWNFDSQTMLDAFNKEIVWDSSLNKMIKK